MEKGSTGYKTAFWVTGVVFSAMAIIFLLAVYLHAGSLDGIHWPRLWAAMGVLVLVLLIPLLVIHFFGTPLAERATAIYQKHPKAFSLSLIGVGGVLLIGQFFGYNTMIPGIWGIVVGGLLRRNQINKARASQAPSI